MALVGFLSELKHRKVTRIALVYTGVAWLLLQIADIITEPLGLPSWFITMILALSAIGFPIALILAWAFELTPEGVQRAPSESGLQGSLSPAQILQVGIIFVLALSVGFLYLERLQLQESLDGKATAPQTASAGSPTIAVLPFVDMSASADQQYFGDGIAEEILNALVGVPGLQVSARTSSFGFHGKNADVGQIGEALGVYYVLEGSVRRDRDQVRITAQLVETRTGFHLFSQTYERKLQDVFLIQNEIAREIVAALLPKMGLGKDVRLVKRGTDSTAAHDLRMRGRHAFFRATVGALNEAIRNLENAVAEDPEYAGAWGDLSYAYAYLSTAAGEPLVSLSRSLEAASRSLTLDPDNTTALLAKAMIYSLFYFDFDTVQNYYQQVLDSGVDYAYWSYNYAWLLLYPQGRYGEAVGHLRDIRISDPLSPFPQETLPFAYWAMGENQLAFAAARETFDLDPPAPLVVWANVFLMVQIGELEWAEKIMALAPPLSETPGTQEIRAWASFNQATGNDQGNLELLDQLRRQRAQGYYVSPYAIGVLHLELGQYEEAINWFETAVSVRAPAVLWAMPTRIRMHPVLRDHPRALALLERIGTSL